MQEVKIDQDELIKRIEEGTSNALDNYCFHGGFSYIAGKSTQNVPPQTCSKISPVDYCCTVYRGHTSPKIKCRVVGEGENRKILLGCNFSPVESYNILVKYLKATAGSVNPLKASKRAAKGMK